MNKTRVISASLIAVSLLTLLIFTSKDSFQGVSLGAATSTIVQNLRITALGGTGDPCLIIDNSAGLVATSTCGTSSGGGGSINGTSTVANNFPYWVTTASGTLAGTSTVQYDPANLRIGVGTAQPSSTLHVIGSSTVQHALGGTRTLTISHDGTNGLIDAGTGQISSADGFLVPGGNVSAFQLIDGGSAQHRWGSAGNGYSGFYYGGTAATDLVAAWSGGGGSEFFTMRPSLQFGWISSFGGGAGAPDALWTREAAATIQQGADAAAPVNQVYKAADGLGTDKVGANLTIGAGRGTGTGIAGDLYFNTAATSTTGSSLNATATRMFIGNNGLVGIGTTQPSSTLHIIGNLTVSGLTSGRLASITTGGLLTNGPAWDGADIGSVGAGGINRAYINSAIHFGGGSDDIQITRFSSAALSIDGQSSQLVGLRVGDLGVGSLAAGMYYPSSTLHVGGNFQLSASSSVVTPSIGGAALLAGACSSATSSIDSSVTSSTAAFVTTPRNDPGDGYTWDTVLVSPALVKTRICALVAGTPTATEYNIKIIK